MATGIALIDGNNFYAACEKSMDPSLTGRAVVVLSNNDGCIISRNTEARSLGIKMGQPYFQIKHRLESLNVIVRSSNYALYGDMSQRMMNLIKNYCEKIEIYSIDEAFVSITLPSEKALRNWGLKLRAVVLQSIGIPIAIGIGANKVQAKLANHLAKKIIENAGFFDFLTDREKDELLNQIAIENIWGIGRKSARWFRLNGINTALAFRDMPTSQIRSRLGINAVRVQYEIKGIECFPLKKDSSKRKGICVSRSVRTPLYDQESIKKSISNHIERACEKLREENQLANSITVFIHTGFFVKNKSIHSESFKLDTPTNDTMEIMKKSLDLVSRFPRNMPITKLGVLMQNLQSSEHIQISFLSNQEVSNQDKRKILMQLIDKLNKIYGNKSLTWGSSINSHNLSMRCERLSRVSSTRIMEIPIALA